MWPHYYLKNIMDESLSIGATMVWISWANWSYSLDNASYMIIGKVLFTIIYDILTYMIIHI